MTTVHVGFPDGGQANSRFVKSLLDMQLFEITNPSPAYTVFPFDHSIYIYPPENRNRLVMQAMELGADWLLQIDPDETFIPQILRILMRFANPDTRPVITGHYANVANMDKDGNGGMDVVDMIFEEVENGEYRNLIPPDDMQPFKVPGACGTGIFLTHMSIYQKFEYPWYELAYIKPTGKPGYQPMNEDIAFCRKLREAGYEIWCDPMAEVTHWKTVPISSSITRRFLDKSIQEANAIRKDQEERTIVANRIKNSIGAHES